MTTLSGRLGPPAMVVLFPAALSFEISSSFFASSALSSRKELALMALDFALVVGAILEQHGQIWNKYPTAHMAYRKTPMLLKMRI
jgi:hypothetical protein